MHKGVQIEIQELANKLTLLGYSKDNVTSTEGFWSRRGEIIDIYPVNNEFPIRLESVSYTHLTLPTILRV